VVALSCLTLVWRAWSVSRWSWQDDDFLFIGEAVTLPLWDYLMQDHNGHFMPGGFLVNRLMVALSPFDFTLAIAVVAVTCAANVLLWGVALARVTHNHVAALLPLAVIALSPVAMEPMMWWAVAVNALPLQLCLAGAVIFAVRYATTQHNRDLFRLGLIFVLGLIFWQKCAFLTIPLAFVLVGSARGSFLARLQQVWRALLVLTVLTGPYLAFYLYWTRGMSSGNSVETTFSGITTASVLSDYGRGFEQVFLPSLFGGPWGSLRVSSDAYSNQGPTVSMLVMVLVAAAVAWIAARHWRALWLVTLPLLYSIVTWGVVLFSSRKQTVWDVMVTERYHADGVVVAMLTVALLMRAIMGESVVLGRRGIRAFAAAGLALAISLACANIVQAQRIGVRGSQEWLTNVRADLTTLPPGYGPDRPLVVVDTFAPESVLALAPTWGRYGRLSGMLSPFDSVLAFNEPTDQLWMVADDGRIVRATVETLSSAPPGPTEGCGYLLPSEKSVKLPMSTELYSWGWGMTLSSFSDSPSELVVDVGHAQIPISLPAGPQVRTVQYDGPVPKRVTVRSTLSSGLVCVTGLEVGSIVPSA
jgi:hypothetical protein